MSRAVDSYTPHTDVGGISSVTLPVHFRVLRAVLYGASVLLSCFLMLVFMTYNVRHSWGVLGRFLIDVDHRDTSSLRSSLALLSDTMSLVDS